MKKLTKWILGILAALVVLAALAGIGYLVFSHWQRSDWMMGPRALEPWDGERALPRQWRQMPMRPFGGMPGHRFGGFFPLRMLSWLVCPGLLALIVIAGAAIFLGRRGRQKPAVTPSVAAPPAAAVVEPAPAKTCPSCIRPVNEDWSHCPYCGATLT